MPELSATDREALVDLVRRSVIGESEAVVGPYGPRPVVYADYTASGRAVGFIEDVIREWVLPLYANTHTESSGTGRQTTRFREDAREIIRAAFGATRDHAVLFCGTGSTGAIDRMIRVLGLAVPRELDLAQGWTASLPAEQRPVVFIGPYEHHSNELPWRESIADVVTIPEDADGHVDLAALDRALRRHAARPLKIGSFSAASNVTGILTDVRAVSILLHRHGALAFWDCAAAAPYITIEMEPRDDGPDGHLNYKDAVFVSPHKLVGGPGTPGLLIARKALFTNAVPAVPGGGTVAYVNPTEHRYLEDVEHREEGGTPDIVGAIRAGLVFQLKQAVGERYIREREEELIRGAIAAWTDEPNLEILGPVPSVGGGDRLSIVSFVVRCPEAGPGRHLHHNFVVALLNDLFGIQSRGGCSCAGPYGHRLLGIDLDRSHAFEEAITGGCEGIKPGWVRVNFTWFLSEATFAFILEAVRLVARHGWRLLDDYRFDPASGLWTHRQGPVPPPMSLHDIDYRGGRVSWPHRRLRLSPGALDEVLDDARRRLDAAAPHPDDVDTSVMAPRAESLRWFPLPGELRARDTVRP